MSQSTATPPQTVGGAMQQLRSHQKTSKGAPAYSLLVNRRLGRFFAACAYVLGRTPNQVTALSAAFTFASIAAIALVDHTVASSVLVMVGLVVGYALDAADGQLARLRGGGSVSGEWLDHVVDAIKIATLHLAVLVNWFRFSPEAETWLLVPLGFQVVASVSFFVMILNDQIRRARRGTTDMLLAKDGSSPWWYSLAVVPTDYGLLCIVMVTLFWQQGFLVIYTTLFAANALFLLAALTKWFREMRAYDSAN